MRRSRSSIIVKGSLLAIALSASTATVAQAISGPAEKPAKVSGASYVFDAVGSGSKSGPGIIYSAGISVLGVVVPPDPSAQAILTSVNNQAGPAVQQMSQAGVDFANQGNQAIAPLAPANVVINPLAEGGAGALNTVADNGSALQPFDRTMRQLAQLLENTLAPAHG